MKLRSKLTLTLLFASLASAAMVGGIAYWLLMRDFSQSVMDNAFNNFQGDVRAYLRTYGSWEQAERSEPFFRFAQRQHRSFDMGPRPPPPGPAAIDRLRRPPFLFLLLNPEGRVIKSGGDYAPGQTVPPSLLRTARPISVDGRIAALAVPLGAPNLSPQDMAYLSAMRRALAGGFLGAGALALLLGLLLGRRMSATLDELTAAIRAMRANGGLEQQVPVRTRDEIGVLAEAFNTMTTELAAAHDELRELSIRDPLTQLYNRRHFNEQAARLYEQAVRFGHPLTVMVGDLDYFKRINDTYSHATGDEVLRRVGALLRKHTRKSDILARHGGEEFVIVFSETSLAQAARHCEQLRGLIEAEPWDTLQKGLRVTMSMGLSGDISAGSIDKMLQQADANLYAAKHAGRNRVEPALA